MNCVVVQQCFREIIGISRNWLVSFFLCFKFLCFFMHVTRCRCFFLTIHCEFTLLLLVFLFDLRNHRSFFMSNYWCYHLEIFIDEYVFCLNIPFITRSWLWTPEMLQSESLFRLLCFDITLDGASLLWQKRV